MLLLEDFGGAGIKMATLTCLNVGTPFAFLNVMVASVFEDLLTLIEPLSPKWPGTCLVLLTPYAPNCSLLNILGIPLSLTLISPLKILLGSGIAYGKPKILFSKELAIGSL